MCLRHDRGDLLYRYECKKMTDILPMSRALYVSSSALNDCQLTSMLQMEGELKVALGTVLTQLQVAVCSHYLGLLLYRLHFLVLIFNIAGRRSLSYAETAGHGLQYIHSWLCPKATPHGVAGGSAGQVVDGVETAWRHQDCERCRGRRHSRWVCERRRCCSVVR